MIFLFFHISTEDNHTSFPLQMNCSKISPTYIQIFINTDYPVSFHSNLPKGSSNKNENYPLLQGHYFNILVYCYFLSPLSSILLPNINLLQLTFPDIPRVPSILKINPNIVLHRYLNLHSVMQEITEKCWKNLGVTWTTEFHTSHYMVTISLSTERKYFRNIC